MPRKKINANQASFLDNQGQTAPAVTAIRQQVREWSANGYKGATEVSQELLNYWFWSDHKLPIGQRFRYNEAQRESVESLIYVYEIAKTRSLTDLYQTFIPSELASQVRLP